MESELSLPCPQHSATGRCPQLDEPSPRSIIILFFHLCLGLPSGLFPAWFRSKMIHISPMHVECPEVCGYTTLKRSLLSEGVVKSACLCVSVCRIVASSTPHLIGCLSQRKVNSCSKIQFKSFARLENTGRFLSHKGMIYADGNVGRFECRWLPGGSKWY